MLLDYQTIHASLTAAGSVQIIPSVSGARWNLHALFVSYHGATAAAVVNFKEVGTAASAIRFILPCDVSGKMIVDWVAPNGAVLDKASQTLSSLKMDSADAGTLTGLFVYSYD